MPITATLEPLLEGDDSVRLREALSQAAWIVLVGTADRILLECLRGVSAPVLVVEPDQELLEQRAEAAAALGLEGMVFLEQVVGATGKDVSWYRYNDSRLNGLEPLAALKPRYPNLALESIEVRQQLSLAQLLQAWEPALVDGGVLVLPEQAGSDWLDGAVSCLQRLRTLCWQWAEPRNTSPQQHLEAVLADCWLVSAMDDEMSQPLLKVWRRDPALHFQATVLTERDQLLKQVQLLESGQAALVAERDGVMAERDALSSQVAVLEGEKGALNAERDGVMGERDALSNQAATLEGEKGALIAERDGVMAERDALSSQVAVLEGEKGALNAERDGVMAERDALSSQVAVLEGEKGALIAERDGVMAERDALSSQVAVLEGEKGALIAERDGVMGERDALSNQVATLEGEKGALIAERDGVMGERDALVVERDELMVSKQELEGQLSAQQAINSQLHCEREVLAQDRDDWRGKAESQEARLDGINRELDEILALLNPGSTDRAAVVGALSVEAD